MSAEIHINVLHRHLGNFGNIAGLITDEFEFVLEPNSFWARWRRRLDFF